MSDQALSELMSEFNRKKWAKIPKAKRRRMNAKVAAARMTKMTPADRQRVAKIAAAASATARRKKSIESQQSSK